jgi:metal-responsive CopG/Arc/MetJ family transcriptional regulator
MAGRRVSQRPLAAAAALIATRKRKVKTSVSLSEGLLYAVDALAGKSSRSAWIERSVRASVQRALRRRRDENEVRMLNEHAESLNRESADALACQTTWDVE